MSKPQSFRTPQELFHEAPDGKELSFKDLRLMTSNLAALQTAKEEPLNPIELNAIFGMIAYVAHTQSVCENTVAAVLTAAFNIKDIRAIPSKDYPEAIAFLVDLEMNKVVN